MTNILIIEDEEILRKTLYKMVKSAGYEVSEASDGEKALELIKEKAFDLVITDIFMPNKDGLEIVQFVKKNKPNAKVISISGGGSYRDFSYLEQSVHLGADKFL